MGKKGVHKPLAAIVTRTLLTHKILIGDIQCITKLNYLDNITCFKFSIRNHSAKKITKNARATNLNVLKLLPPNDLWFDRRVK